jgi:hypothetical protein
LLWQPVAEGIQGYGKTRGGRTPDQAAAFNKQIAYYRPFFTLAGFAVENELKGGDCSSGDRRWTYAANRQRRSQVIPEKETPRSPASIRGPAPPPVLAGAEPVRDRGVHGSAARLAREQRTCYFEVPVAEAVAAAAVDAAGREKPGLEHDDHSVVGTLLDDHLVQRHCAQKAEPRG